MSEPAGRGAGAAWEAFWQRTSEAAALAGHGAQDELLARFWSAFLDQACATGTRRRMIDLACGNGAVARIATRAANGAAGRDLVVIAIDRSIAAVEDLKRRTPGVLAVACDARRTPFPDRSFDVATSQFGVEYAGEAAIAEAARIVAPGGLFGAVMHLEGGAMYRENMANLDAARALQEAGLLPDLKSLFMAEAAVGRGSGSRVAVREADAALQAALAQVDGMLGRLGAAVAGGMAQRLRSDVDHMRQRLRFHDAVQVMRWCDLMAQELTDYTGRMASMLGAAVDAPGLDAMVALLQANGFSIRLRDTSSLGRASREPAVWLLVGERA